MFRTPHRSIHDTNPVFDFELRRIKRLAQRDRLWRYSALVQFVPSLILCAFYLFFLGIWLAQANTSGGGYISVQMPDLHDAQVLWLLSLFLLMLGSGWYYLGITVHSVNQQMASGHWEQLRITPVSASDVITAKQAIAEIRAWRLMNIEVGIRLLPITLLLLIALLPPDMLLNHQPLLDSYSLIAVIPRGLRDRPITTVAVLGTVLVLAIAFINEPRWRMRALLSLGLYISSTIRNASASTIAAFFGLFAFYFLEAVWLSIGIFVMVMALSTASTYAYDFQLDEVDIAVRIAIFSFGLVTLFYSYYALVRILSRQWTLANAFLNDGRQELMITVNTVQET